MTIHPFIFAGLALGLTLPTFAASSLERVWQTEGLRTPESVLVYHQNDTTRLFVSEIEGEGAKADGLGGIAVLSATGEILDADWVRGLNAPKGMAINNGKLYVADLTELVVIDIKTGKIDKKFAVADAVFLNDVAATPNGIVYVSDTRTNRVHRLKDGKLELWLENVSAANGLFVDGADLLIGANTELIRVDTKKHRTVLASGFESGIDGIEKLNSGHFIVTCWVGLIYEVDRQGKLTLLVDSREDKTNTADLGYNAHNDQIIIPNFFKNTVTAYKLKQE